MGDILEDRAKTATVEWRSQIERDLMGLETIRRSGGITVATKRDALGRPIEQVIDGALRRTRTTKWGIGNRILSTTDSLTGNYTYTHDNFGNLVHSANSLFEEVVRAPDAIGNLFKANDRSDRVYGKDGRVLEQRRSDGTVSYTYDPEGNLTKKSEPNGSIWNYNWNGSGQLITVDRPDGKQIAFTYDVLGRRLSKTTGDHKVAWVWDGNSPVHEIRTKESKGEVISWLFEDGSFTPVAKLIGENRFDIVTDHLGTPVGMYDARGSLVWHHELSIWGERNSRNAIGEADLCPFRYPGQYEDIETGLYYNRFRYFDPELGQYTSVDPIGLAGGNPTLFGYVGDPLRIVDVFGLACNRPGGYKTGDVDSHRNLSPGKNRAKGHSNTPADDLVQSHHPVQDAWAEMNIAGYSRNTTPATLLKSTSGKPHANISATQRSRRAQQGWNNSLKTEMNVGYKEMIDSGVSKKQARKAMGDSYKYFDSLRGQNANNPLYDI